MVCRGCAKNKTRHATATPAEMLRHKEKELQSLNKYAFLNPNQLEMRKSLEEEVQRLKKELGIS